MSQNIHDKLDEAEARARYYQAQYDFLVHQVPNPMFLFDPDSEKIVEANNAAVELLGYSKEALLSSLSIYDIHPQEMELFRAFSEEVYQQGSAQTEQLTCMTAAGRSIPVQIHATFYENRTGRKLIRALVVDNSAQQVTELALLDEVQAKYNYEEIIGESSALQEVLQQVALVAPMDQPAP